MNGERLADWTAGIIGALTGIALLALIGTILYVFWTGQLPQRACCC